MRTEMLRFLDCLLLASLPRGHHALGDQHQDEGSGPQARRGMGFRTNARPQRQPQAINATKDTATSLCRLLSTVLGQALPLPLALPIADAPARTQHKPALAIPAKPKK